MADGAGEAAVAVALESVAHRVGDRAFDLGRHDPRRLARGRAGQRTGVAVDLRHAVDGQADVELLRVDLAAGHDVGRSAEAPQHRRSGVDGAAAVGDAAGEAGAEGAAGEQRTGGREDDAQAVDERYVAVDEDSGRAAVASRHLQRQRRGSDGRRIERFTEEHRDRGGERLAAGVRGRRHRQHARRHRLHDEVEVRDGAGGEARQRALATLVERRVACLQMPVRTGVGWHGVAAGDRREIAGAKLV
ncbi:MAG TPA: hypothetical protein VGS57_10995, partial [Thermoanaerobaculia bacterium]|nr:hypothetical protein [Thermoanaerobaculia bacterium]